MVPSEAMRRLASVRVRLHEFVGKCAALLRIFASLRSSQERWKIAQDSEKGWWMKTEPYLYGWTEHFRRFGFTIPMNLKAPVSNTNSVSYKYLFNILGFDFPTANPIVADVGSGTSGIGYAIRDASVLCLEPLIDVFRKIPFYKENVFEKCKDKMLCKCVGEMLPLRDESLDAVFCLNVLDHCQNVRTVLEEISRTLVEGGMLTLYVSVWISRKPLVVDILHPNTMSLRELNELVEQKHFRVLLKRYVTTSFEGHALSEILVDLQRPFGKHKYGEVLFILKKTQIHKDEMGD